jgi:ribose 5-phosphate isomerase RpiB
MMGHPLSTNSAHGDLLWQGRVLAADLLRRSLNGHRRVLIAPGTVVTPLAAEELRSGGIELEIQGQESPSKEVSWGCAQDRAYGVVQSALQALKREEVLLRSLPIIEDDQLARWARAIGDCVARSECCGGVVFCQDPGLVCCVANKLPGLRAVAVATVAQAARATLTLGANLLAVEMPGRTFFEVRQILRQFCAGDRKACPDGVSCTLQELDGHAHR